MCRVDLSLVSPLRASIPGQDDILPSLRKARALFVILALSEQQSVSRRSLARLLWSRNDPGQSLARLRDTLRTLRQSLRDSLDDPDLVQVVGDRVALRPGIVRVDLDHETGRLGGLPHDGSEIGADLNGIDPALDEWLLALRSRLCLPRPTRSHPAPRRGSVIGVCLLTAIGLQADDYLAVALSEEIATAMARIRGLIV
ncbi:MAG: hypothetical protein M3N26_00475, partial [Pseudomonadota bacterium]|nr:hypothetical protein [Pseudomonadota bacterium]